MELVKSVAMSGGSGGAKIAISRWVDGLEVSAAVDRSKLAKAMAERITGLAQRAMATSIAGAMAAEGVSGMARHLGGDITGTAVSTVRSARLGGSVVVAGLDVWIMLGIAREACSYYANKTA
ncbi:MAG TPA: hypothetical protein VFO16_24615 [Pseudonocardiaceae bacterium]|nr:hypothetical protein [Pseudonocardiaceae bacterium]